MSDLPMAECNFLTSWGEDKMRLPKHRSLPELHLRIVCRPICGCAHCQYDDDGSRSLSAQHAKHAPMPRVQYTRRHRSLIGPHDGPKIQGKPESETTPLTIDGRGRKRVPYLESTKDTTNSQFSRRERIAVATATLPALQLGPTLQRPHKQPPHKQKEASDSQSQLISDSRDPVFDSTAGLVRLSSTPSSVDRSDSWSSPMTVMKPSRSLKASRRNLVVGLDYNDTKKSSLSIDNDNHDIFKEIITDDPYDESRATSSKRFSPLPPPLRTIRRRKRLSIGRSSNEASPVKPIAISLTFSSSPTPQILLPKVSMSALCDRVTYPAETDSESKATFDAPSSPINPTENAQTQLHVSPERQASPSLSSRPSTPNSPSTSFHSSVAPVNVRLGHPSRPYYSAIRKQGISPPSSRRSSIKDPALSPTRPKSYSPSSPLPASSKSVPGSPRHLSLSAVPHTSSFVSAFSLDDDSDDNVDEELPMIPLTPAPVSGRMSFGTSLAGVAKSLTRKRSKSGPSAFSARTTTNSKHSHSLSLPPLVFPLSASHSSFPTDHQGNMKGKGFRMGSTSAGSGASGIGFSVSGETELKMALAFSEAQTDHNIGLSSTTPAIQEEEDAAFGPTEPSPPLLSTPLSLSPISPPSSLQLPTISNSRNTIASRVKRLKQGLKDMLLTTTHAAGKNMNSTTTTTTPS